MKRIALTLIIVMTVALTRAEEMDAQLAKLAESLGALVKAEGKKKITVLDFADLQGRSSELGRYIAEQLTVELVLKKSDFSVLDRANLKSILSEHKLTAKGLIDPENAKKLGMFSGVDALILGTIIPKKQTVALTARIITTDTAEVIGAAKAEFKADETVQELLASATVERGAAATSDADGEGAAVVKTVGDMRVAIETMRIVNEHDLLVSMTVSNPSKKKRWVALKQYLGTLKGSVINTFGDQYSSYTESVSGLAASDSIENTLTSATELDPGASVIVTLKFGGVYKKLKPGRFTLQLEFLLSTDFNGEEGSCIAHNLITKVDAK